MGGSFGECSMKLAMIGEAICEMVMAITVNQSAALSGLKGLGLISVIGFILFLICQVLDW